MRQEVEAERQKLMDLKSAIIKAEAGDKYTSDTAHTKRWKVGDNRGGRG